MNRLLALTLAAVTAAVIVRQYRRSDVDGWLDIFDARTRRVARDEIAKADAEWDDKTATDLGILGEAGYQRQAARLRAELDDPNAVTLWLTSEGRA